MTGPENKTPFVAIACGGTGGHLFPGIAVAEQLQKRGCAVALLISPKDIDQQSVKAGARRRQIFTSLPAVGVAKPELFFLRRQFREVTVRRAEIFPQTPARRRSGDGRIHQRSADFDRERVWA